ncbi:60S ribosomal protein L22-2 [Acorus calamus]|uniref:Large ribosomal subunit protein eL22 n=1 Tax=Acorus calamus TaxID=4465 RepID=A0AAV9CRD0_ACOCL|nr:60S ribosomal protein L22-2 [Acorus calamus]
MKDKIMDIASLKKFLQERIKVSGDKAGNLGDFVTITRDKDKITVVSDSNFSSPLSLCVCVNKIKEKRGKQREMKGGGRGGGGVGWRREGRTTEEDGGDARKEAEWAAVSCSPSTSSND